MIKPNKAAQSEPQAQFFRESAEILEMIATGQSASNIYDAIALMYEARNPGIRCSLLELKGDKLMHGGAPSLPKEYCDAVNGLKIGLFVPFCDTHPGTKTIGGLFDGFAGENVINLNDTFSATSINSVL